MKTTDIVVVRIYITESSHQLNEIMTYLKTKAKIRGLSVFRAINGFGETGRQHSASLLDLSLNLPLIVEFFDHRDVIEPALEHLSKEIKHEHIVFWDAKTNA